MPNKCQDIEEMVDLDGPPIEACPPLSCTALNTLGIAPVAATLGVMPYLPTSCIRRQSSLVANGSLGARTDGLVVNRIECTGIGLYQSKVRIA